MRILLACALIAALPVKAHAACSDDATAVARKYGVTATLTPGKASDSTAAKTEHLAKSGGVIAPPSTGDMAAAQPDVPNPEPMQTAPSLPAQTADGGMVNNGKMTGAATISQAASLLQAAREAGTKGNEEACHQRLAEARALLEKAPSTNR